MKQLQQLRMVHRERLEAELRELEQLKAEYMERRTSQRRAMSEGCASEDEVEGRPDLATSPPQSLPHPWRLGTDQWPSPGCPITM